MDTPSEAIIKAANATEDVKDASGRVLTLKKLTALDRMRLFEVVGAENVKNDYYLGYATLAFQVVAIDGVDVARPTSKLALEGLVQRLGDDGINAIAANARADTENDHDAKELVKNA
jgi:hypothetical protein